MRTEMDSIHGATQDAWQAVRDALDIVHSRLYESDDADEQRELMKASKALNEALMAICDDRHRANLQRALAPQIVPAPCPAPRPAPWEYPRITWGTKTDDAINAGRRTVVTS